PPKGGRRACDGSSNLPSPTRRRPGGAGRMASQSERQWHRRMAVQLFNSTWDLMAKKRRTKDEDDRMIHMAHASRYHWSVVGGPKEADKEERFEFSRDLRTVPRVRRR